MIHLTITEGEYVENGELLSVTNNILPYYVQRIDNTFFHIEVNGRIEGRSVLDMTLNGVNYQNYNDFILVVRGIKKWEIDPSEIIEEQ